MRLRHRQGGVEGLADPDGRAQGQAPVHVARAGLGPAGRRALGHLLARRCSFRDAHRPAAVRRRQRDLGPRGGARGPHGPAARPRSRRPARGRRARDASARPRPRRPLPDRRRDAARAREVLPSLRPQPAQAELAVYMRGSSVPRRAPSRSQRLPLRQRFRRKFAAGRRAARGSARRRGGGGDSAARGHARRRSRRQGKRDAGGGDRRRGARGRGPLFFFGRGKAAPRRRRPPSSRARSGAGLRVRGSRRPAVERAAAPPADLETTPASTAPASAPPPSTPPQTAPAQTPAPAKPVEREAGAAGRAASCRRGRPPAPDPRRPRPLR